jgi:peptide/nickel transport system permease protein
VSETVITARAAREEARLIRRRAVPVSVGLAGLILVAGAVCAIAGPALAPYEPGAQDLLSPLQSTSSQHWLGTDNLGRDELSQLMVGSRTALEGPIIIAGVSMAFGVVLGLFAGYLGGIVDTVISRWVDVMYSLPSLLVAIVVVGVLGGGYWVGVLVMTILFIPFNTRLIRSAALEQRGRPYVEAALLLGLSRRRIAFRHIFPMLLPLIATTTVLDFAFALVSLSGLSFLGLGVPPGAPDWGRMLAEGIPFIFENSLLTIVPGVAIALTATSVNLLGDWLFGVLDERLRSR